MAVIIMGPPASLKQECPVVTQALQDAQKGGKRELFWQKLTNVFNQKDPPLPAKAKEQKSHLASPALAVGCVPEWSLAPAHCSSSAQDGCGCACTFTPLWAFS